MTAAAADWRAEALDQVRGFSGGLLFGIPLLFTMEVWWVGAHTSPRQMAVILAGTLATVAALTHVAGFRADKDATVRDTVMDTVEAVAMGLLASLLILVVTRQVTPSVPFAEALGKVIYHGITASIGVALAAQFFRGAADSLEDADGEPAGGWLGTVIDLGASAIGTVFVVSAIAPTDEVPMLAAASSPAGLFVVVAVSLVVSYGVVFVSGFSNQLQRRLQPGVLQHPVTETVAAYIVALLVCLLALLAFQRIDLFDPAAVWLPQIILLGLPGAVGGAAGRLAV